MEAKLGFLGCGSMGGALARAAAGRGAVYLSSASGVRAKALAGELGGTACDNETIARSCNWIFLGVKPQMMEGLLKEISPLLAARQDRFVLVTMAAGLTVARIREMAGGDYPVLRLMPNTPVSVGAGMTLYCAEGMREGEIAQFLDLMSAAGRFDALPESLIDAGSAVSGCGPAFVYLFLEAMADGGVACGLPRAKALEYAAQTLLGAAQLTLASGQHPGQLKDAVCSPGGSTIQGVRALENGGLRAAVIEAVVSAYEKTKALGGK